MEGKDVLLRDFNNIYIFPRAYKDNKGNIISDGLISDTDRSKWNGASTWVDTNGESVIEHIGDTDIHVTTEDKEGWLKITDVYPLNSVFITTSQQFNPNNAFDGTVWTLLSSSTIGSNTLYYWERTS